MASVSLAPQRLRGTGSVVADHGRDVGVRTCLVNSIECAEELASQCLARVRVDGREVGATPVRVRLDPSVDHVVQFENDGCDVTGHLRERSQDSSGVV